MSKNQLIAKLHASGMTSESVYQANQDIAHLSALLRWAGCAAGNGCLPVTGANQSELGCAVMWAAERIDERAAFLGDLSSLLQGAESEMKAGVTERAA